MQTTNSVTAIIYGQNVECWLIGEQDTDPRSKLFVCEKRDVDQTHHIDRDDIIATYFEKR